MMPNATDMRKARFKAALALSRTSAKTWAEDHGVTRSHLNQVLAGHRESASLLSKVDDFIALHLEQDVARSA